MSPVETRKIIRGIPVSEWTKEAPGQVLYRSTKKEPFKHTHGDWNVGRTHISTVRVGKDGETIACDITTLIVPVDYLDGPRHGIVATQSVTLDRNSITPRMSVSTGKPFLKREIRIT